MQFIEIDLILGLLYYVPTVPNFKSVPKLSCLQYLPVGQVFKGDPGFVPFHDKGSKQLTDKFLVDALVLE